jgi:hypothetical protein
MKLTLQRTGHERENNIKIYLKGVGYEALNLMLLVQGISQCIWNTYRVCWNTEVSLNV